VGFLELAWWGKEEQLPVFRRQIEGESFSFVLVPETSLASLIYRYLFWASLSLIPIEQVQKKKKIRVK
jgi:hypothetical protein